MSEPTAKQVQEHASAGIGRRAFEHGRRHGLIEAARALDERHGELFNKPDLGSRQVATGVREASRIVRMIRKEGARA